MKPSKNHMRPCRVKAELGFGFDAGKTVSVRIWATKDN